MAKTIKKTETKPAVSAVKKDETKSNLSAKKEVFKSKKNDALAHLDGLHDYYNQKNIRDLKPFISKAIKKLKEIENLNPVILSDAEDHENKFNELKDHPNNFNDALLLTGKVISLLNFYTK